MDIEEAEIDLDVKTLLHDDVYKLFDIVYESVLHGYSTTKKGIRVLRKNYDYDEVLEAVGNERFLSMYNSDVPIFMCAMIRSSKEALQQRIKHE